MTLDLIAIDMDATLLRDDKSYDTERFERVVEQFLRKGTKICIASGNILSKLQYYIDDTIHDSVYLAGDNGNVISKDDELIEQITFDKSELLKLQKLSVIKDDFEIIVSTGGATYATELNKENEGPVHTYYEDIIYLNSFDELPEGENPTKIAIFSPNSLEENKRIRREIIENLDHVDAVTSGYGWIDIYSDNGGKGTAIQYLQNKYGIAVENTIAFGDSLNDEPMMEFAHYSVAMDNADDELKSVCNYVIGNNEDQSVISILEQYLKEQNLDFMDSYLN